MAFAASFPFPPARPRRSWRARFRSALLDLVTAARDRLVAWQADDYTTRGTEPVVGVTQPGSCWTITGRYGQVLVSTNLPIWDIDVDGIDGIDDETVVERLSAATCGPPDVEVLTEIDRFRIYRTHSGVRVICTTRSVDLRDPDDWAWFAAVGKLWGADPIYMRGCERQFTCRARLEPKPHRLEAMGLTRPEARACRLIAEDLAGSDSARDHFSRCPALVEQIRVHDQVTNAIHAHELPLA
jgi:hypothetical protein